MNVEELVSALTLEEKAGLSPARFLAHQGSGAAGHPGYQRSAMAPRPAHQKKAAPTPTMPSRPYCFPAGCAAAASFDPALTRRMGAALGREARASGVQVLLGPAVNIKRSLSAAAILSITPRIPTWRASLQPDSSRACRVRGRHLHQAFCRQQPGRRAACPPTAVWTSARCTKSTCPLLRRR